MTPDHRQAPVVCRACDRVLVARLIETATGERWQPIGVARCPDCGNDSYDPVTDS